MSSDKCFYCGRFTQEGNICDCCGHVVCEQCETRCQVCDDVICEACACVRDHQTICPDCEDQIASTDPDPDPPSGEMLIY